MATAELLRADDDAHTAGERAGVAIRELHTVEEIKHAETVLAQVWKLDPGSGPVDAPMLVALGHGGNYVVGAYRGEELTGVSVGFFTLSSGQWRLHSHITGVLPAFAGHGIGHALKLHQRAWCLRRGITTVTWTYDPLVARNAHFNLHRLRAQVTDYVPDFYGPMRDGVNAGEATDRMVVTWHLDAPDQQDAGPTGAGRPVPVLRVGDDQAPAEDVDGLGAADRACRVQIPADIETMRVQAPARAGQWRRASRRLLTGLIDRGWRVTDFDDTHSYVLRRE